MADNVTLNSMTGGPVVAADEVTDSTLGTVKVQYVKLMDGAIDSTTKASVDSANGLRVLQKRAHQPVPYTLISGATTNATSVSTTANTLLYGYFLSNLNGAAWRYVKFYNKASAPTVGTDTPVLVLALPPNGAANASFPAGINFSTGLAFAITAGVANSNTDAVAADEVVVNLAYAVY